MSICKDCIHYEICDEYVSPCESFPETDGCKCFKSTADVVEVVRCRDCKYFEVDDDGFTYCVASLGLDSKMPIDYCSDGERRAKDDNQ